MGVDCKIMLPGNVRIRDVANVIAILAGKPKKQVALDSGTSWYVKVDDVWIAGYDETAHLESCAKINILGPLSDAAMSERKESAIYVMWHWEPGAPNATGRLLLPRSTPFWLAVGKRLVEFFGGELDYNDCDETDVDLRVDPKPDLVNCPEDGSEWQDHQLRMWQLEPLGKADFDAVRQYAAY